ncbi:unnamed protein product [Blepharisma stoltei]|uniref:Uncharacterized protein n=1 Tax=Blepharisma stoltei TaxID=1481888 RepID=A0AAU9JG37_9CILI|nr:unnamed protein product [Blepharisma stoltei]
MIGEKFTRKESLKAKAFNLVEKGQKLGSPKRKHDSQRKVDNGQTQSPKCVVKNISLKKPSKLEETASKSPRVHKKQVKQKPKIKSNSPVSRKIIKENVIGSLKWEAQKRTEIYKEIYKNLELKYCLHNKEELEYIETHDFVRPSASEKLLKTFDIDSTKSPRANNKIDSSKTYKINLPLQNTSPKLMSKALYNSYYHPLKAKRICDMEISAKNFKSETSSPNNSPHGSFMYKMKTTRIEKFSPSKLKEYIKYPKDEILVVEDEYQEEIPVCPFKLARDAV